MIERHTLALLLENTAGSLSRVAGLFSARAYNIESLSVAPTEDPTISRMTVVTSGSPQIIDQIVKQLNKLIDVIVLVDLSDGLRVERELLLVKMRYDSDLEKEKILKAVGKLEGVLLDTTEGVYTAQITGPSAQLDEFVRLVDSSILELARSGTLGLQLGPKSLSSK
ncbi:MAG: acetolactate synthase small subunit [Proteobacteria bacterium]|nr:acetolactate synthase small subunit [Pseudomonadota bacterium]